MRNETGVSGSWRLHVPINRKGQFACNGFRAPVWMMLVLFLILPASRLAAQELRFSNYREVKKPDYATLRIGSFYSTLRFTQSAGYRYTASEGTGTDYLLGNELGQIREEGSEIPLVTTLDIRNYLIVSRQTDVDLSLRMSYEAYPLNTQEDDFYIGLPEEGIYGNLSTEFRLSPFVNARIFDDLVYRTDYIDTRGLTDEFGGEAYENFNNVLGVDLDWLMVPGHNMGVSLSREDEIPMDDDFADQQRVSWNETVDYGWQVLPWLVTGVSASFQQNAYTASDSDRADSGQQTYRVNGDVRLTPNSRAALSAGYTQTSTDGDSEETSESVGSAAVTTRLAESLEHSYGISRTVTAGFSSAFETTDSAFYRAQWKSDLFGVTLDSTYDDVTTGSSDSGDYADWTSSLAVDWSIIEYMSLNLTAEYNVRENAGNMVSDVNDDDDPEAVAGTEIQNRENYETLSFRAGASCSLLPELAFETYVQRVERFSDAPDLEYTRDILMARLVYTHQF